MRFSTSYDFKEIESKWQKIWKEQDESQDKEAKIDVAREDKVYCLG